MTGENAAKELLATKNDGELVANMCGWAANTLGCMTRPFRLMYINIKIMETRNQNKSRNQEVQALFSRIQNNFH